MAAVIPPAIQQEVYARLYAGLLTYASQAGWRFEHVPYLPERLAEGAEFDGIVGVLRARDVEEAHKRKVPAVNAWVGSDVVGSVPGVLLDIHEVGRIAARHLIARGLTRFAHMWQEGYTDVIPLGEGFADELHRQDKPMELLNHMAPLGMYEEGHQKEWMAGVRMIDEWITSWKMPIGIFSNDHLLLNTVARRCRNTHGLNIPRDVAVLCTSTQDTGDMYPMSRISGIRTNYEQVGLQAAGLLDRLMKRGKPPKKPILVQPGEVIMRESTDVTAVDDPNVAAAMHFMADECQRRIHVADVARAAAMGRRTLERRFRETVGTTIAGQLEYLRVERAKRLLAESREPSKAVALQCGYGSALQLYRAFMRRERMTPTEYRKRIHGRDR